MSRKINARFSGKCKACGCEIVRGEEVYFEKGQGVRCTKCGPHPGSTVEKPKPSSSSLTPEQLRDIRQMIAAGHKLSRIAKHVGMSWQKLHAILQAAAVNAAPADVPAPAVPETVATGDRCAILCEDGVWRYEFGSVGEATIDALADYGQNEESRKTLSENLEDSLSGHRKWANNFTKAKFLKELSQPSKSLLSAVDEMRESMIEEFAAPTVSRRKVRRNQEWGEELDPDRYMAKSITPWDRSVRQQQPSRNVTIGVNLSVNSGTDASQLLYRGAAALALADILTGQGFNVGIVAFESCEGPTSVIKKGLIKYTLKESTMPLDISAVAFAMCEIAWVRIVGIIGEMRHFPGQISPGYGRAVRLWEADRKSCDFLVDSNILGREQAQEWLRTCVSQKEVAHA